jgi:glutathione S-transferase
MRAKRQGNLVITIPISHYCERARWALDRAGVAYEERAHVQAIHRYATLRAGGGLTAPVLVCADGVLADSAEILAWAAVRTPPDRTLYPERPEPAARVRRLESEFATRLGPHARRWMYQHLRLRRDIALRYGCAGIPAWERASLRVAYPLMMGIVTKVLDVTPAGAMQSELEVRAVFDAVAERLSDGRPFLFGERFTAADLTFAAMAAPMLMPRGYGVPLPAPEELPCDMTLVVEELRAHPAGAHALQMFATQRR